MTVKLGKKYRDAITGFEGIATSRHEYMYGCVRITLEGGMDDPKELTFDEQRLEGGDGRKPEPTATSGGSRTAPPRTGQS